LASYAFGLCTGAATLGVPLDSGWNCWAGRKHGRFYARNRWVLFSAWFLLIVVIVPASWCQSAREHRHTRAQYDRIKIGMPSNQVKRIMEAEASSSRDDGDWEYVDGFPRMTTNFATEFAGWQHGSLWVGVTYDDRRVSSRWIMARVPSWKALLRRCQRWAGL
jgi:hypothetical protein